MEGSTTFVQSTSATNRAVSSAPAPAPAAPAASSASAPAPAPAPAPAASFVPSAPASSVPSASSVLFMPPLLIPPRPPEAQAVRSGRSDKDGVDGSVRATGGTPNPG
ncbi:hypothetical protein B9W61_16310 [Streptomyces sp. CS057]|nr:hypothetical protein B9W61_16310 [Streptomyces sp. CS057]